MGLLLGYFLAFTVYSDPVTATSRTFGATVDSQYSSAPSSHTIETDDPTAVFADFKVVSFVVA